jgi:hypothetical protein
MHATQPPTLTDRMTSGGASGRAYHPRFGRSTSPVLASRARRPGESRTSRASAEERLLLRRRERPARCASGQSGLRTSRGRPQDASCAQFHKEGGCGGFEPGQIPTHRCTPGTPSRAIQEMWNRARRVALETRRVRANLLNCVDGYLGCQRPGAPRPRDAGRCFSRGRGRARPPGPRARRRGSGARGAAPRPDAGPPSPGTAC